MENIGQYAPSDPRAIDDANAPLVGHWSLIKLLIAACAFCAFSYGLIAAEVKLANAAQISEPYPR